MSKPHFFLMIAAIAGCASAAIFAFRWFLRGALPGIVRDRFRSPVPQV